MAKKRRGLRRAAKKLGRTVAKVHSKVAKVVTPIVSAAATVAFGPAAGAAVSGIAGTAARFSGATAARARGIRGRAARTKGRQLRADVIKMGLLGTGIGTVANVGIAAVTGQNVLHSALGGQVGKSIFGGGSPAAQSEQSLSEQLVTQNELGSMPTSGTPLEGIVTSLPGVFGGKMPPGGTPPIIDPETGEIISNPGVEGAQGGGSKAGLAIAAGILALFLLG